MSKMIYNIIPDRVYTLEYEDTKIEITGKMILHECEQYARWQKWIENEETV